MSTASLAAAPVPLRQDASLIGLIGVAHLISHFSQLLLPPLFPWLRTEFGVSYAELGFLMSVFFVVSCVAQTLSGFFVDRFGPRPVLYAGLGLLALAAFGYASSTSYAMLLVCVVVGGLGNGVFHPVDYTLINRKVSGPRLGHAYSVHGISGNLGWAVASALVVPLAMLHSWRVALAVAGCVVLGVLLLCVWQGQRLAAPPPVGAARAQVAQATRSEGALDFLRIPAVWMCFAFFFIFATALSVVQAYAPEAARQLHAMPQAWVAVCLTAYMVASACGMVAGGFLATDAVRSERLVGTGFGVAACISLVLGFAPLPALAVPVLFAGMGLAAGFAGPARDLLIKRSTPEHASGRVYGVVYAGLDIGQAVSPLVFGWLMDHQDWRAVFVGLALVQLTLVVTALRVRHTRRTHVAVAR
ncbi:MFS transporter [Hylemonella gracilis str. Niagara R]|uniref:MFS transporter n=1 Tax=Hylemonella gracilis str. Niagara R TaxID=1458275 RepID=A0A016XFH9_9BURK|nr:MFS transporter [Hylemonella gracilis]EYC50660.1 MFS transporter [Hylemonella gracilis str. Niagara R]